MASGPLHFRGAWSARRAPALRNSKILEPAAERVIQRQSIEIGIQLKNGKDAGVGAESDHRISAFDSIKRHARYAGTLCHDLSGKLPAYPGKAQALAKSAQTSFKAGK